MSGARHDQVVDRLEQYVLGELTPAERHDIESHLHACASCSRALRELQDALTLVAESAPSLEPPEALKARVVAAVAVQPQDPPQASPFGASRGTQRWRWLSVAAAVMMVALAGLLYQSESSRRALSTDAQRANADLVDLRTRLQRFSAQTDLALSILTAADMRELSLAGRENATAAAARAYWSPTRGLLVVADRMPTPPPGRIYQVWVIAGGTPLSAGLLGDQAAGRGMLVAPPPRPGTTGAVTVAVTDEPPGGLAAPSGAIRLAGSS